LPDLPFAETRNKYGRMQLTISLSWDAADGRLWFNRQIGQQGGSWSPPAVAPAFREGVNVLFTGTEEIQKVHAHVFAGLTKAQQNQVISESLFGGDSTNDLAKRCERFDSVFSVVVVPRHPVEAQKRKELVSVFLQPLF
jgi:hypothetical protein